MAFSVAHMDSPRAAWYGNQPSHEECIFSASTDLEQWIKRPFFSTKKSPSLGCKDRKLIQYFPQLNKQVIGQECGISVPLSATVMKTTH